MKLGILGTGKIVENALFALEPVDEISVNAIFARPHSRARGEALASRCHIPSVFTDYQDLLRCADVDTVYVGLINSIHYAYARQALEAGKHVILEKPFTGTFAEAQDLMALAKDQGCFVFEAITVLHSDVIRKMREALPRLGPIRMMLANYSQYSSRYDRYLAGIVDHSFDPAHLGGALRDINVYNIHYAVSLFGAPKSVQYYPNAGFNGVDTSGTLVMTYDGFSAVCTGAKDSDSPCFVSVQGEKGFMRVDGKPNVAPNLTITCLDHTAAESVRDAAGAVVRPTITEHFIPPEVHHRMTQEFRDFARIIDTNDAASAAQLAEETLEVMRVIELAAK